jgi:two-component system, NtrC family, nitrogen regulation response regulator NtrX
MPETLMLAGSRAPGFVQPGAGATELAGSSAAISHVHEIVRRVAALDGNVLLIARRGCDAQSVAREIHARSPVGAHAFVSVACGGAGVEQALFGDPLRPAPPDLESLSADSGVAAARGGTLFLEDATELPASVQARLARLTRDGEARIDGEPVPTAMRLIVSAPPGIDADVREHRFRSDVYRRVSTLRVDLPPLSERPEDVPDLAIRVLEDLSTVSGGRPRMFTQAALALLRAMSWPGNLAELRETVHRAASATEQDPIQIEHVLPTLRLDRAPHVFAPEGTLRDARQRFEHDYIAAVLQHHGWRMADAAQTLGIQRPNLYRKARQLGIPLARGSESE